MYVPVFRKTVTFANRSRYKGPNRRIISASSIAITVWKEVFLVSMALPGVSESF